MSRILLIKLGAAGDVLRTTALLPGLKEKYSANITWLVDEFSYDLLKNNSDIDEIIIFNKETAKQLMEKSFDLIINLEDGLEACKLVSELKTKKIFGAYYKDNNIVYSEDSQKWFDMGLASRLGKEIADEFKAKNKKTYQDIMCKLLGIKKSELVLELDNSNHAFAKAFADRHKIKDTDLVIGVNTGAGDRWPLKKLSIEKTAELCDLLASQGNKVLLFGGPEETERNRKIIELVKEYVIDGGCNNTLLDFAALVNLCKIVISSDSLAMHIAIALKKHVIAFFGPTPASEIDLYGKGKKIVSKLDCLFCYKRECNKEPNCMDGIRVQGIFNLVMDLNEKISSFETISCNLCGSRDAELLFVKSGFKIMRCNHCHLVYVNPRLKQDVLATMYNQNKISPVNYYVEHQKEDYKSFVERLKLVERYIEPGKLLEIGCSVGTMLTAAKKRGWQVKGIDINKESVRYCKKNGLDVEAKTIEEFKTEDEFDLIIMNDLLEHVPDPVATLMIASSFLRKNGILFIATPNISSLLARASGRRWLHLKPDEHIYYFSEGTIRKMLMKTGFQVLRIQSIGRVRNLGTAVEKFSTYSSLPHKTIKLLRMDNVLKKASIKINPGDEMGIIAKK